MTGANTLHNSAAPEDVGNLASADNFITGYEKQG